MTRDYSRRRTAKLDALAPILVIVGMKREAACAAGEGVTTLCSGADVARLRRRLDALEGTDFSAVVSFGLAGGLDHALRPGHIVVADAVVSGESRRDTHSRLSSALTKGAAAAGCNVSQGAIIGVDAPAMHHSAKAALRESAQAVAVDMESHLAARFAARHGLPFAALRAISDPAGAALPALVKVALRPDGRLAPGAILTSLWHEPRQIAMLPGLAGDSRRAFAALADAWTRAASILAPG